MIYSQCYPKLIIKIETDAAGACRCSGTSNYDTRIRESHNLFGIIKTSLEDHWSGDNHAIDAPRTRQDTDVVTFCAAWDNKLSASDSAKIWEIHKYLGF